jgi:hypothetical protein
MLSKNVVEIFGPYPRVPKIMSDYILAERTSQVSCILKLEADSAANIAAP